MKQKLILLSLLAMMMAGGRDKRPSKLVDSERIVTIDSCEYIYNYAYYFHHVYTHKGNCKY